MLEDTTVTMLHLAEYVEGEPPPPGSDIPGAAGWNLVGVIRGPHRGQIPEAKQEAVKRRLLRGLHLHSGKPWVERGAPV